MRIFLTLFASMAILLVGTNSHAGVISYRIDSSGNILESNEFRYFTHYGDGQQWVLSNDTNQIKLSFDGGGIFVTPNTTEFTVADITHVSPNPYFDISGWVTESVNNLSHRIDVFGNIIDTSDYRYFRGFNEARHWVLNDDTNEVGQEGLAFSGVNFQTLNTTEFTVADITHVSSDFNYGFGFAWVRESVTNRSHLITSSGTVFGASNFRYFSGYSGFHQWILSDDTNQIRYSYAGAGTFVTPNTTEFTVADIIHVSPHYLNDSTAWVTVEFQDTAGVPEPSTWALLTLAGIGFGGYKLRCRKRTA